MTLFNAPILGGYGFGYGFPVAQIDAHPEVAPQEPVKPADPVDRQNYYSASAQALIPGFDAAPPLSIPIIWQMRRFSTIVLAHTIVTAPILAGKQSIEIVTNDPDKMDLAEEMKAAAEEDILPTVDDWLVGMLENLHFGYFLQEVIWQKIGKRIAPAGYHSVLPGEATIYRDKYGCFTGYQINQEYRDARYALLSVNNAHIDPIFGESRNANCREEWWRIRQSELNADRIERKPANVQMSIGVPMGDSFVDDNNKPIFPKDLAQSIVNSAVQNMTFTYPLYAMSKKDIKANPDLAGIPGIKIDSFDWGDIGNSLKAVLSRGAVGKIDIMRAWHRPEREAMQGTSGTNAESETQGAIGTTDSELVANQGMRQFTHGPLRWWCVTNYGPESAGLIAVKQSPLSDPQQTFLQKMALAMATNTATGPELQSLSDTRGLCDRVELPILSEEDAAAKKQQMDQEAADKAQAMQKTMQQGSDAQNGPQGDQKPGEAKPVNGKPKLAASDSGHNSRALALFDLLRDG